jgi:hypothetical protein
MVAELRAELHRVARLLRQYGIEERASSVDRLAMEPDDMHVLAVASGLELWGGSGAVWEVEPFNFRRPDAPASDADYIEFLRAMVRIAEILDGHDLGHLSRRTADIFRRELRGT